MKPGRNSPCPCGSGKKYKRCCGLKEESEQGSGGLPGSIGDRGEEDTGFRDTTKNSRVGVGEEEALLFFKMMNNFRRFTLDNKAHIKEYYKARKLHEEIMETMIDYFEDGKFEQKIDTDYRPPESRGPLADRKKGETPLITEIAFDFNSKEDILAMYDMLVYKNAPNMSCITEDFINSHRYRKPEKIEFLQSMLDSRPGLFEITDTDFDEGYAYLKEVFTGVEYKIVDIALSAMKMNDGFAFDHYYYLRIISYRNTNFNAGIHMAFKKTDRFIIDFIQKNWTNYDPHDGLLRFEQLFKQYSNDPNRQKVVTNTIK